MIKGKTKKHLKIISKKTKKLKRDHDIDIDEHIQLVSITEAQFNKACNITDSDEEPMLPKPVDIVLYIETTDFEKGKGKRKYLVMSVNEVPMNIINRISKRYPSGIIRNDCQ